MDYSFKDKVVIITGSAIGLGKATAERCCLEGAHVVINARNQENLLSTQSEFKSKGYSVLAVAGDITQPEVCRQLVEQTLAHFGRIDALINNAAQAVSSEFADLDPTVFNQIIKVNLVAPITLSNYCIPHLKKTKGSIIFISSIASFVGLPSYSSYSTTKVALTALAQSMHTELKPFGVHVGILYPGFIENYKEKVLYDGQGNPIPMKPRKKSLQQSQDYVAGQVLQLIRKRKFRKTLSFLGKLNKVMSRLSSRTVMRILAKNYYKNKGKM